MKILLSIIFLAITQLASAQEKWTLQKIVEYAMQHNIGVRLTDIQAKNADLTYKQSKQSVFPNASFNNNSGINSGNNQDPTTFSRVTQTYFSSGYQLQSSVDVFNWFSKRNQILANEWELKAAEANTDKIRYDIALSAANAYLQVLLALEQQKITGIQVQQTTAQLQNTKKLVDAGALPYLNLTQLEAQLALDSSNYISAKGAVYQNILSLKNFMSLPADAPFEVDTPPVSSIPIEPIAALQPQDVYTSAMQNQPLQKFNSLKIQAAEYATASAKAAMYPSISLFGSLSSNYLAFKKRALYNQVPGGFATTPFIVNVNGQNYNIQQPVFTQGNVKGFIKPDQFFKQMNDNFRQSFGVGINVPIFNGAVLRTNYKRSQLNEEGLTIQKEQDDLKLKQDIYSAYNAAVVALEKLNASEKSVKASDTTLEYAQKRFNVGMLNTFDLITSQNNLLRARLEYSLNQFDYVFKMKVLEYYKGLGLKL